MPDRRAVAAAAVSCRRLSGRRERRSGPAARPHVWLRAGERVGALGEAESSVWGGPPVCWVAGASRVVQCLPGCRGQSGRCTAAAGLACASPFCAHAAKCPNDPAGPCWPDRKPAVTDCNPASVHDLSCLPAHSPRRAFLLYAKANTAQRRASRAARNSLAHPLLHRHALCPPPHQSVLARLAKRARSSRAPPKLKGAWSACSCASTRESPGAPLAAAAVTATFHSLQLRCPTSAAAPLQAWRFPQPHTPMKHVAVTA